MKSVFEHLTPEPRPATRVSRSPKHPAYWLLLLLLTHCADTSRVTPASGPVSHLKRAEAALEVDDRPLAYEEIQNALGVDPLSEPALLMKAGLLLDRGEPEDAHSILAQLVEQGTQNPQLDLLLGRTQMDLGQPEKALAPLARRMRKGIMDADAVEALYLQSRALAAMGAGEQSLILANRSQELGRILAHRDAARVIVEETPHQWEPRIRLGRMELELFRFGADHVALDRARIELDEALRAAPDASRALFYRAEVARHEGNTAQALAYLDLTLIQAPDMVDARLNRAFLRSNAGDKNGAESDLRHVLNLDPDSAKALALLAQILRSSDGNEAKAILLEKRLGDLEAEESAENSLQSGGR